MGELFGASLDLPYSARIQALLNSGVALWDVCLAAHRPGSLDAAIRKPEPNNFAGFFESHPKISLICFNGAKAASLFESLVVPKLTGSTHQIQTQLLPSTSAANAIMPYSEKLTRWKIVQRECET